IGGLLSSENPTRVNADLAVHGHGVSPVTHQSPGDDEWPPLVDRRNGIACRKRCELLATVDEKGISLHHKRADRLLHEGIEGGADLTFGTCLQDAELNSLRARCVLHRPNHAVGLRTARVDK